ncbi:MAG: Ldh family oxidoreductase [Planctomycetota bacterium]
MNQVDVKISELKDICVNALLRRGASDEEAHTVFDDYLDAEVRGRTSHGFVSFGVACDAFPLKGRFEVSAKTAATLTIHGNGDCGHIVCRKAIDLAVGECTEGVMAIGVRDITRFNCPGPIARYATQHGLISIVFEYGGMNFMVPYGGKSAALSTNPIGIAIPGTDPLFVMDIATSERAIGFVALAKLLGHEIPANWGINGRGESTSDPSALKAMQPFGGYKGYGLSLAFEILSGALVGVPIGSKGELACRGSLIILIKPTIFGVTQEAFEVQVVEFLNEVLASEPLQSEQPVVYPGYQSQGRVQDAVSSGVVRLAEPVFKQLKELS